MNLLNLFALFCISFPSGFCNLPNPGRKVDNCESNLNGLVVTWAPPGSNNPLAFSHLPRTVRDAEAKNWILLDDACEDSSLQHKGKRYILGDDLSVLIIYDGRGHVAGLQTTLPKDVADSGGVVNYESLSLVYFENILGEDRYVLTTYFIKPSSICRGRTNAQFRTQGTIEKLYIQNGKDSYLTPPLIYNNASLTAEKWTKGLCVKTMGLHLYLEAYENESCSDMKPYFLMYNCDRLVGMGRFMIGNFTQEPRYEFVPMDTLKMFIDPVPHCLYDMYGPNTYGVTSFHTFFTDSPQNIDCPAHN